MTNLEIIRQACIKANPEIIKRLNLSKKDFRDFLNKLEEKDGYKWHNGRYGATKRKYGDYLYSQDRDLFECNYSDWLCKKVEIRLADVLLAIWKKDLANRTNVILESSGQFRTGNLLREYWDLKHDNLELQSEETIKFLAELLK